MAEVHVFIRAFDDGPRNVLINALVEGVHQELNGGHHVLGDMCHHVRVNTSEHWSRADAVQSDASLLFQLPTC